MKRWKIVPEYSPILYRVEYRIYRRVFWIFWEYQASRHSLENAVEIIKELDQSVKYL